MSCATDWICSCIMVAGIGFVVCLSVLGSLHAADDRLLGAAPPEWQVEHWLNSKPLALKDLKGKVVLVRWWTAGGCPFCVATAPALNEFHETYHDKGLIVIGFYHHKGAKPLADGEVERAAQKLGFKFPVAVDPVAGDPNRVEGWQTLNRWWLAKQNREWTSVTFLLDRQGVIRHIHPGGQYVKGDEDYKAMKAKIEELLASKP